jgi:hypothetical protein
MNGKVKIVKLNVDEARPGDQIRNYDSDAADLQERRTGLRRVGGAPRQQLEQWITCRRRPAPRKSPNSLRDGRPESRPTLRTNCRGNYGNSVPFAASTSPAR